MHYPKGRGPSSPERKRLYRLVTPQRPLILFMLFGLVAERVGPTVRFSSSTDVRLHGCTWPSLKSAWWVFVAKEAPELSGLNEGMLTEADTRKRKAPAKS